MTKLTNQQFQATNLANILVFASLWPQYGANTEWADPCRTKHKISCWIFLNCLNFSKWFAIQPACWERSGCNWQTVPSQLGRGRLCGASTIFFYECGPHTGTKSREMTFWPKIGFFWPNIGPFGPFGSITDQKTMQTRCLGGFFVTWVPKLLLPPIRIRIFGPKKAIFGPKFVLWAEYWPV